jgi:protoheme IX farnesyltransferase
VFVWTPPHFWALALHRREDYAEAEVPMLPVTHGPEFTRLHILLYSIMLLAVTLLPFAIGMSGWLYLTVAMVLGLRFVWLAAGLKSSADDRRAMPIFRYSILYLFALFACLMADHYLRMLLY